jgi:hypothetical protein
VFLASKFLAGAWVVVLTIPLLMILFSRIEGYYVHVASELRLGRTPPVPRQRESVVIVPTTTVNLLTEKALSAALSLGDTVVAVAVAGDSDEAARIKQEWGFWDCSVPLEVVVDPQRSLVRTVLRYIRSVEGEDGSVGGSPDDEAPQITVLIAQLIPGKRRHELLHNQRGRLLESVLKSRTNVVVAVMPFHLHD